MALKLSGSISLTGSLASNSSIEATVVSSSFFTGSYLDSLGESGSDGQFLMSDGIGGSSYSSVATVTGENRVAASAQNFSITWEGGLNFSASAAKVFLPDETEHRTQLGKKAISLSAADSSNPRFDAFVFRGNSSDETSGSVEVVEGTPSENPVFPDIDLVNEVPLKYVLLKAGASLPSDGSDENDTSGADFSSANIYSNNANDGNSWRSFGPADSQANVSQSIFVAFHNSHFSKVDYEDTTHGTAINLGRLYTSLGFNTAHNSKFGFIHPEYETEGLAIGTLDNLTFEIKFPSEITGSDSNHERERKRLKDYGYFQVNMYEISQLSNGGQRAQIKSLTYLRLRELTDADLDYTNDSFQKFTIPANKIKKIGNTNAGTKINFLYITFYKSRTYFNNMPVDAQAYIRNVNWDDGSGPAAELDTTQDGLSKAAASEPVALSGKNNNASGTSTAIVAGENNTITTNRSFIGAGRSNLITGNTDSVIGGGSFNSSSNSCTFIGGGSNNIVTGSGTNAIVVGGTLNTGSGACSFIGGGEKNNVTGSHSSIVGGQCNGICGTGTLGCNIIGGGFFNRILNSSCRSGILGGTNNTLTGTDSSFIIGTSLVGTADCTTYMNNLDVEGTVSGSTFSGSFVGDGSGLTGISGGGGSADDDWYDGTTYISSSVGIRVTGSIGGEIASATGPALTVGYQVRNVGNLSSALGFNNYLCASQGAFIGGGHSNKICASANASIIGAGNNNLIHSSSGNSGIFNGQFNKVTGSNSNVVGGCCNNVGSVNSLIGGGARNLICTTAVSSSILGGFDNTTACTNSHIIGSGLTADKPSYTFMNNLDVEGTVSGSIFSGSFVGDGSGLTGISGGGGSADDDWGDAGTYISSSKGISVTGGITGSALTIGNNHTTVGGSALASILAGSTNCLSASNYSAIIGGAINRVKTSAASTITHGCSNCVSGSGQSIVGGRSNCAMDADCVGVLSGFCNLISGSNWNVIGGGYQNNICRTTYGAGGNNIIGGGQENCITGGGSWTGYATFIGAGRYNTGSGGSSAIGAGMNNSVSQGDRNFIGAGFCNCIYNSGDNNFIGSGELNKINSYYTGSNIIIGGCQNCVVGTFGTIVGGRQNCITHKDSFIAGTCITSSAENTFYVNNLFSTGSDGSNNVVIFANLPTSDPTNAGQLWNDSGTLKISAG